MAHMTTSGFSIDRIDVLRDARCYVTALMFDTVDEDTRPALAVLHNRYAGQAYGWGSVITRGWNILFARDLPKFRFKFLIDFAVVFLALDAVTRPITHTIVFSWLLVPILLLVGYNAQRFMTGDHAFDQMSPESFWEALRKYGARAIINVGDIRGKRPQAIITSDLYAFFDSRSSPSASEVARAFRQLGVAVVGDPPSGHSHHETVEVALTDSSNGQCQVWSEPAMRFETARPRRNLGMELLPLREERFGTGKSRCGGECSVRACDCASRRLFQSGIRGCNSGC